MTVKMGKIIDLNNDFGIIPAETYVNEYPLTANTAIDIPIPNGAEVMLCSSVNDIKVCFTGTAVLTGTITDGSGGITNPTPRSVRGLTSFSIISDVSTRVSVAYYAK